MDGGFVTAKIKQTVKNLIYCGYLLVLQPDVQKGGMGKYPWEHFTYGREMHRLLFQQIGHWLNLIQYIAG